MCPIIIRGHAFTNADNDFGKQTTKNVPPTRKVSQVLHTDVQPGYPKISGGII